MLCLIEVVQIQLIQYGETALIRTQEHLKKERFNGRL